MSEPLEPIAVGTDTADPSGPAEPGRPLSEPSQSAGTAVLEREELQSTDDGDADRFAHYVRKDKIAAAAATGRPGGSGGRGPRFPRPPFGRGGQ